MLASKAKLIFTCSLVFLIVVLVLTAWGFPKIVGKQIQKVSDILTYYGFKH